MYMYNVQNEINIYYTYAHPLLYIGYIRGMPVQNINFTLIKINQINALVSL